MSSAQSPPGCTLDGKTVWVTGASRGLGRAIVLGCARAGARVAVTARTQSALDEVCAELSAMGGQGLALAGSVTDSERVADIVDEIAASWSPVDVLINNAGVSPALSASEDVELGMWSTVIDVNLTGALRCARAVCPYMLDRGGSIVNISSIHGRVGMERLAAYCASKGGLEMLTRALAVEWANRKVRVNAVAPGYLETEMTEGLRQNPKWRSRLLDATPLGRFGAPDDVVPAVVFLASDAAGFITGATLPVDGGWTSK